jgi:hypothetical protein
MNETCFCGDLNCWPKNDHSWLSSNSGWHGDINGCQSNVFFIHGRKIREQRHIPYGSFAVADLPALFAKWSEGLPDARLLFMDDIGGGDPGIWIEGVREPTDADNSRLEEARARMRAKAVQDLDYIHRQFPDLG